MRLMRWHLRGQIAGSRCPSPAVGNSIGCPTLRTSTSGRCISCAASSDKPPTGSVEVGWLWQTGGKPGGSGATRINLRDSGIKAKKSLGQNFLTDDTILADIVAASRITPNDLVLEVGPGTGNLTRHLVATGARVTAVEKDDTLFDKLQVQFAQASNLRLIRGDVMRVGIERVIEEMQEQARHADSDMVSSEASSASSTPEAVPRRNIKVVANLPYNITKEFLKAMLPMGHIISELNIMIQDEVAIRLGKKMPKGTDYRAMSVFTHFYSKPKYRLKIPRTKYFPVPGVDGALVTFALIPPVSRPKVASERGFLSLVNKAFSEKRKMIRNSLQPLYTPEQVSEALTSLELNPSARAQELSLQDFVRFYNKLQSMVVKEALGQELVFDGVDMTL